VKILILHQHFRFPDQAGSTRVYALAKGLNNQHFNVTVVTGAGCRESLAIKTGASIKKGFLSKTYYTDNHMEIISIEDHYDQKLTFTKRLISFFFFACFATYHSLKIRDANLVFASSTPLSIALPAVIVSKLKKLPFIFEVRDLWPEAPIQLGILKNPFLIRLSRWLEAIAYRNAIEIIGISQGICRKISSATGKAVRYIPHGVEEHFGYLCQKPPKGNGPLKIVYAGSCGYNNAIEILFEVAKHLSADPECRNNLELSIIGDGPALDAIRQDIPSNVKLLGKKPKTEVVKILCGSDLAIFSQRMVNGDFKKDSLPNKFFDYIGASLPVVAGVQKGGELDVLINSYECGIAVEPEDISGLVSALKKLVFDPELRRKMSLSASKLAKEFSREKSIQKFVQLVESTIRKGNAGQ
jgi:glycosyltransferase involved in cell wall biosynthesis